MRARLGAAAGPIVVLNPNASDLLPLRKWETARFGELATRILAAYPAALRRADRRAVRTRRRGCTVPIARLAAGDLGGRTDQPA